MDDGARELMRRRDEDGFTLIEVLVALVVTGLLLSVIFQSASLAAARLHATADRQQARIDGSYLLAHSSADAFIGVTRTGKIGALSWISRETVMRIDQRQLLATVRLSVQVIGARGATLFDGTAVRMKALPAR